MSTHEISSNDALNLMIHDTISTLLLKHTTSLQEDQPTLVHPCLDASSYGSVLPFDDAVMMPILLPPPPPLFLSCNPQMARDLGTQGKKKRRQNKIYKNKEEAETHRRNHITIERNRRKQMNHHLSVLRALMPQPYSQKGDQASIVGGAIEYVKHLEHLLHLLQAQKCILLNQATAATSAPPQYTRSHSPAKAEIEVTLMASHVNLRILVSMACPRQLSKLVAGFHLLCLSVLHLNVTSLDSFVLYSISAKVEEGCQLTCVDDIAEATNHMLRIIEEEAGLC